MGYCFVPTRMIIMTNWNDRQQQMLLRTQRHWNFALMMQNKTNGYGKQFSNSSKLNVESLSNTAVVFLGLHLHKNLGTNVQSSITDENPKVEPCVCPSTDKHNMVYSCNEIFFINRKQCSTDTWMIPGKMLSERRHTER